MYQPAKKLEIEIIGWMLTSFCFTSNSIRTPEVELSNLWSVVFLAATKPVSTPAVTPPVVAAVVPAKMELPTVHSLQKFESQSDDEDCDREGGQGDIQPVGHDYVEEVGRRKEDFYLCVVSCVSTPLCHSYLLHDSVFTPNCLLLFRFVTTKAKWFDSTVNCASAASTTPTLKTCTWRGEGTDCSTRWGRPTEPRSCLTGSPER